MNDGICSPFMTRDDIPWQCQETQPDWDNDFLRVGPGWSDPGCLEWVQQMEAIWTAYPLQSTNMSGLPVCICNPPYGGLSCETNLCPQNIDYQICSNAGNPKVGYTVNSTSLMIGDGCQCDNIVNLDGVGYCGLLETDNNNETIFNPFAASYTCFCDPKYYGVACEYGVCPSASVSGAICSNRGHPEFGFGYEANGTNSSCTPVCAPQASLCDDYQCQPSCPVQPLVCPEDTPYRCPNTDCVSGTTTHCDRYGYVYGVLDRWNMTRELVVEETATVNLTSPLFQMIGTGRVTINYHYEEETMDQDLWGYVPNDLWNPYQIKLNGTYTLSYQKGTWYIAPAIQDTPFQFLGVVADLGTVLATASPFGDWFIITDSSQAYQSSTGLWITLAQCYGFLYLCAFEWDTQLSLTSPTVLPLTQYNITRLSSRASVYPRLNGIWQDLSQGDIYVTDNSSILTIHGNTTIQYVLVEDLLVPCICQAVGVQNQTDQNLLWWNQGHRLFTSTLGAFGLGIYATPYGDARFYRGIVLGDRQLDGMEMMYDIKLLKQYEFESGLPVCDVARCSDGSCTLTGLQRFTNTTEWCQCQWNSIGLSCSCVDVMNETTTCEDCFGDSVLDQECYWSSMTPIFYYQNGTQQFHSNTSFLLAVQVSDFHDLSQNGMLIDSITEIPLGWIILDIYHFIGSVWDINATSIIQTVWSPGGTVPLYPLPSPRWSLYLENDWDVTFPILLDTHPSLLTLTLPRPYDLVALFIVIERPVSLMTLPIQVQLYGDDTYLVPFTLNKQVTTQVLTWSIMDWFSSLTIYSPFPIIVHRFVPLVTQNCSYGILQGVPSHLPCSCNDTCLLEGIPVWNDGICQENFTYKGLRPIPGVTACFDYTDCTDCHGHGALCTLPLGTSAPIRSFLDSATFYFDTTLTQKTIILPYKTNCTGECPFTTCLDGSCASFPSSCPNDTLFNCDGNGCVRPDIYSTMYKCACRPQFSGLECQLHYCIPGDPLTGLVDPHSWCTCNGPSPLKMRPPASLLLGGDGPYGDADILRLNRPYPRSGPNDVRWVDVQAHKAPYGVPFLRINQRGSSPFYTNCPYQVKTSYGVFLELEDCVLTRDPYTLLITEWRTMEDNMTYVWINETHYDDAPYRCSYGHCVANARDCYNMELQQPVCNGNGRCTVDGSCQCNSGWTTFIISSDFNGFAYDIHNPTIWDNIDDNQFTTSQCMAIDCSVMSCTPPLACYSGSLENNFQDAYVLCSDKMSCAVDNNDCLAGVTEPPMICSGNGVLRQIEGRPEEWICICAEELEDGSLVSNGFGGTMCQDYLCQDNPNTLYFQKRTSQNTPFLDINGLPLYGKWFGPCDSPAGPSPDDANAWVLCCPGIVQLETCLNVLCTVGGSTQCIPVDDCTGTTRTPLIYPCNNKGTVLGDGTCDCDRDESTGTGYIYDYSVFSYNGCWKAIQCPVSISSSQSVCNAKQTCGNFDSWSDFPFVPYVEQQIWTLLYREGNPLTNRSIYERLYQSSSIINEAFDILAIQIQGYIDALESDICVYPHDNASNPIGMLPYDPSLLHYNMSINYPRYLNPTSILAKYGFWFAPVTDNCLFDGLWGGDYCTVNFTALLVGFSTNYYISAIRIHTSQTITTPVQVSFIDINAKQICNSINITTSSLWHNVICVTQYIAYDFATLSEYQIQCGNSDDYVSLSCQDWIIQTCPTVGGIPNPPGSLTLFTGCNDDLCCVPITDAHDPVNEFFVILSSNMIVDEMAIFGYNNYSVQIPSGLQEVIYKLTYQKNCTDELLFDSLNINNFEYFTLSNDKQCDDYGGVGATIIGDDTSDPQDYAQSVGQACTDPTGCFVAARDRTEIHLPPDMTHFINPVCSLYGCFNQVLPGLYGVSDPGNGLQWTTNWNGQHLTWSTFIQQIYTAANQFSDSGCVVGGCRGVTFMVYQFVLSKMNSVISMYTVTEFNGGGECSTSGPVYTFPLPNAGIEVCLCSLYYGYSYANFFLALSGPAINLPPPSNLAFPTYTAPTSAPISVNYWATNNSMCTLIVYRGALCGNWVVTGSSDFGAFRTYSISAIYASGEINLFKSGDLFNQCVDGGTVCTGYGQPLISNVGSLAAYGECDFIVSGTSFTRQYNYTITVTEQLKVSPFYITNEMLLVDSVNSRLHSRPSAFYYPAGCLPELGTTDEAPGDSTDCPSCFSTIFDYHSIYAVYPLSLIKASQYNITFESDVSNVFTGTDGFNMGWTQYPYMCVVVSVIKIAESNYGQITNTNVVLIDNEPVVVSCSGYSCLIFDDYSLPFVRCNGVQTSRTVMICPSCYVSRTPGLFSFNPQFYYTDGTFADEIDEMNQTHPYLSNPGPSSLFSNWVVSNTIQGQYTPMTSLLIYQPRVHSRLTANLTGPQYNSRWFSDVCVIVVPIAQHKQVTYQFRSALCQLPHSNLCIYDLYKYESQAGTLCDVCGDLARTSPVCPGCTAFSQFPLASARNYPFGHEVLNAYLSGSYQDLVPSNEYWDFMATLYTNISIIMAFPEAREFLYNSWSTRPGQTSPGLQSDPNAWVDMNIQLWFPYDCGPIQNPITKVTTRRCAQSIDYCIPPTPPSQLMDTNNMPLILHQNLSINCGIFIDPSSFVKYDAFGFPQPSTSSFTFFGDGVLLVNQPNGTWRNTGKSTDATLQEVFTVSGSVTSSSTQGQFRLYISNLSPYYSDPTLIQYISPWLNFGNYILSVTPDSTQYFTMGWEFQYLVIGSTIEISKAFVITPTTLHSCSTGPTIIPPFVELPLAMDSLAPFHTCLYTPQDAVQYDAPEAGVCYCDPSSPFNGPSCEWPSTNSEVCSGYGETGLGNGLNNQSQLTPLLSMDGPFQFSSTSYQCKCYNPGLLIRTLFRPSSQYDYLFTIRNDQLPDTATYTLAVIPSDIAIPTPINQVVDVCASNGAIPTSWLIPEDIQSLISFQVDIIPTMLDLQVEEDDYLIWTLMNQVLSPNITIPVQINQTLIVAANWNNLVFNTSMIFTDGRFLTCGSLVSETFEMNTPLSDVMVEIYTNQAIDLPTVYVDNIECLFNPSSNPSVLPDILTWECESATPFSSFYIQPGEAVDGVCEIKAFDSRDMARVLITIY